MNTFDPVTGTYRNLFAIPPYASSNLHPHWIPQPNIPNPPSFQPYYTPFNPPYHTRRRGSYYYYNPHHLRHQNQRPHPQWRPYRHVRSEETLRPEAVRPQPEYGFGGFEWKYPDFDGAFGMGRGMSAEARPVSPLEPFGGSEGEDEDENEVDYEPGYAETIPNEDESLRDANGGNETGLDRAWLPYEQHPTPDSHLEDAEATNSKDFHSLNQAELPADHQLTDSLFKSRWQDLLAREAGLAARENTFNEEQKVLANERAEVAKDLRKLNSKHYELDKRERELEQIEHKLRDATEALTRTYDVEGSGSARTA